MNLKKIIFLLCAAIGCSNIAIAGAYTSACVSQVVSIPCESSVWDFNVEFLYVEATTSFQYFGSVRRNLGASRNTNQVLNVEPDFELGYQLEGIYHFGVGNDLGLSWETFHQSNFSSRALAAGETDLNSGTVPFTTAVVGDVASGLQDFEFDTLKIEFGQAMNFATNLNVRLHAGMQYARIDYLAKWDTTRSGTTITRQMADSAFDGFGVRAGGDAVYAFNYGLNMMAGTAFSILVGDIKGTDHGVNPFPTGATTQLTLSTKTNAQVIPSLMGKLGLSYLAQIYGTQILLEGGWHWEGYYHVLLRFQSSTFNGNTYDNFTLQGPYFQILFMN